MKELRDFSKKLGAFGGEARRFRLEKMGALVWGNFRLENQGSFPRAILESLSGNSGSGSGKITSEKKTEKLRTFS